MLDTTESLCLTLFFFFSFFYLFHSIFLCLIDQERDPKVGIGNGRIISGHAKTDTYRLYHIGICRYRELCFELLQIYYLDLIHIKLYSFLQCRSSVALTMSNYIYCRGTLTFQMSLLASTNAQYQTQQKWRHSKNGSVKDFQFNYVAQTRR